MYRPSILLADDHTLIIEGFRRILEGHYNLVGTATDGRALLDSAKALQPDIIILDVSMPLLNGIDAAGQLKKICPQAKLIFVTMHADTDYVRAAFEAGASAYVLKRSAVDELEQAIRAVIAGHSYITPLITKDLLEVFLSKTPGKQSGADGLTMRQREVLQLLTEGRTAKDIAGILHISSRTVEFHKGQIMEQLKLQSTADLIKYAIAHGIVTTT
ncbi:MAG: response regulator transcription factor [Nitrospira sp.]|jgi:DNA-binding NarL/FixJ family response regulator|nr:response regulator transcription factor [Nitrospira sp.]